MTADDLDKTLGIITAKAKALRDAGICGVVKVGDIEFRLTEPETPQLTGTDDAAESTRHALDDPHTFGGAIPERRVRGRELRTDDANERD